LLQRPGRELGLVRTDGEVAQRSEQPRARRSAGLARAVTGIRRFLLRHVHRELGLVRTDDEVARRPEQPRARRSAGLAHAVMGILGSCSGTYMESSASCEPTMRSHGALNSRERDAALG
jgi:hypothetical protein